MATINSICNTSNPMASSAVTIDPGAGAGDSYIQFDINTTNEFRIGVDDTDGDAFKISQGNALGTTDTFIMSAAGERTMPLQSAFLAYLPSDDNNVTGTTIFTIGTVTALTEVYDQNSDFNTNGTFTAPVTARYLLCGSVKVGDIKVAAPAMLHGHIRLNTSNRTYYSNISDASGIMNSAAIASYKFETIADMDAADTVTVGILITGPVAPGQTADVLGQANNPITYFCGCLIE